MVVGGEKYALSFPHSSLNFFLVFSLSIFHISFKFILNSL